MKHGFALCALLASGLAGCGGKDGEVVAPAPAPAASEISADDLRRALGMDTFLVEVPKDGSYGLTLKHAGGFAPTGFFTCKGGDRLRAFYWLDGDRLKYSLQSKHGSCTGEIPAGNPIPFTMRSSPDTNTVYKPGDIVALWTVNDRSSSGRPEIQPGDGEAGVVFMLHEEAKPSAKLNLQPAAPKPDAPPPSF